MHHLVLEHCLQRARAELCSLGVDDDAGRAVRGSRATGNCGNRAVASGRLAKDEFKVARRGWHFQHYVTAPREPQTGREIVSHIVEGGCGQPRPTIKCLSGTRDNDDQLVPAAAQIIY